MYEMKPEYYTGIEMIDKEHARLFELVQQTSDLLNDEYLLDKANEIVGLVSELINYTRTHFSHEEEYMEKIGYAGIKDHIPQHRKFEDKLMEIDLEAIENDFEHQDETVEDLLGFLLNWLVDHILYVDMKYVKK